MPREAQGAVRVNTTIESTPLTSRPSRGPFRSRPVFVTRVEVTAVSGLIKMDPFGRRVDLQESHTSATTWMTADDQVSRRLFNLTRSCPAPVPGLRTYRLKFRNQFLAARRKEEQMTSKGDYTDEEWVRLRRAPFVAGMAIMIADPGGPIEIAKESFATLKAASAPSSQQELVIAVSQDIQSMAHEKQNPMGDFKPESSALAAKYVLDELTAVNDVVSAKATPEEADALRGWLVDIAQASADAAKEGGFMGFGAELVSEGEQRMLEEVRSALGISER